MGLYIKDDDYPWVIGVEVSAADVFAPVKKEIWWLVFIILGVAAVVVGSGIYFGRYFG